MQLKQLPFYFLCSGLFYEKSIKMNKYLSVGSEEKSKILQTNSTKTTASTTLQYLQSKSINMLYTPVYTVCTSSTAPKLTI